MRKAWQCECGFCSSDQDNFSEHVCTDCLKPTITPTLVSVPHLPVGAALPPCISRSHISRDGHISTASASTSTSTSSIIGKSNIMNSNNNNSSRSSNDGAPADQVTRASSLRTRERSAGGDDGPAKEHGHGERGQRIFTSNQTPTGRTETVHQLHVLAKGRFACTLCTYHTNHKGQLNRHTRVHTGERLYKCDDCDYRARHRHNLTRHQLLHSGEKPFECDACPYIATKSSDLKRHSRMHAGDKPHECSQCGYRATQKWSVIKHMRQHATKTADPHLRDPTRQAATVMTVLPFASANNPTPFRSTQLVWPSASVHIFGSSQLTGW